MSRPSGRLTVLFATLAALLFSGTTATNAQRPANAGVEQVNGREAAAGEVLVRFRNAPQADALNEIRGLSDADSIQTIGRTGLRRLRSRSFDAATLLRRLANHPDVLYAEPNYIVHAFSEPDDPSFPQLWGLRNVGQAVNGTLPGIVGADIHALQAWDVSLGSSAQVVAVVDTGIDYRHPDLAANMWSAPAPFVVTIGGVPITCPAGTHGFNAITLSCDPMDDHHHGTHVAGTIGASGNNGAGVVGVNWITQLMGIKFLDATGSGTEADAIIGIEFAIQAKQAFAGSGGANVRVLSNSWGGTDFSQALLDEIRAANDADMLFVAAAGNSAFSNDILPTYPASYDAPNVVSVAATTNRDARAWFSNYGALSVHLGAPGVDVFSTVPGGGYAFLSGTSMATPHVSGAAALVLSQCALDTAGLKDTLLSTVEPVASMASTTMTGGRLDVNSAIRSCIAPPAPPTALSALAGDGRVTLQWSGASGATSFNVKRSPTSGGPYSPLASGIKVKTYIDTAVVNGTTYYYVVSASNALGDSADSNEAAATPKVASDLAVSAMTVPSTTGAGSSIVLTETTKNQGPGTSVPSTTRFYLSRGSTIDAQAVLLDGAHDVPSLPPGATNTASVPVTIPADAAVGAYYIVAKADADSVENETLESNNTLARQVSIGPDLVVSSLTVPSAAAPGGTIVAGDTVRNQGGGVAGATTTKFYLSTDTSIDAGDPLLEGSRSVPGLAAGGISSGSTTLLVPATVTTGSYYLLAKADAENAVGETQESNNTAIKILQVGGDLVVSALTAPAAGGAGTTIVVTDTTRNQGAGPVAASMTRFYLSTKILLDPSAILLAGGRAVPELASGASSSGSTTLLIPSTATTGSYYLIAKADADSTLPETQETNNTAVRGIAIGSDLVVSVLTAPSVVGAGATIVVSDTTANQGAGAVDASVTRFYLSGNTALDAADTLLGGAHNVPTLAAGATNVGSTSVTIPPTVAAGTYYLIARADADDAIAETQETNNTTARSLQVGGDLVVSVLTAPATGGAGATVTVTDTTKNQGAGAVSASVTRFYLSTRSVLDSSAILLAGSRVVPDLAGGASSSGSTTLLIPSTATTGSYYVIAKADADSAVPETQETNNTAVRGIAVGGDLVVSVLTAPSVVGAGSTIVVSDTTANQGAGVVDVSVTRFYLSGNTALDGADTLLAGAHSVPGLAAGATSVGSTSVTLPSTVAAGTYYLIAKADADDAVLETQDANNTTARSLQIGGDLVVSVLTVPATGGAGATVVVNDTTKNQGAGALSASVTRFYVSNNSVFDASDALLSGSHAVPDLAAASTSIGSTSLMMPSTLTVGTWYIIAKADADNAVPETQETNNTAARSIAIGPDLTIASTSVTFGIAAGSTVPVATVIENKGGEPADPSTTRFYLSADVFFDAGDLQLAGAGAVPALAAGGSSSGSTPITIPAGTSPGYYYLFTVADTDGVVVESHEDNNRALRAIQITAGP